MPTDVHGLIDDTGHRITDHPALSPENQMVLNELDAAEGHQSIPRYGENVTIAADADAVPVLGILPTVDGKVECPECHKPVKATYLQGHMLKQHRVGRKREFKPRPGGNGRGKKKSTEVATIPTPAEPSEEPLTVDGIMSTLVELRWPHSVPTKKVTEMLEIRSALEKFLA